MKRNRPKQHNRRLKSGKKIVVNKGVKRRRKKNEVWYNLDDRDYIDKVGINQEENTYGRSSKLSGSKVGNGIIVTGFAVPGLPDILTLAAGKAIKDKVDHVRIIKTDEHDKPYKIPRVMVQPKNKNYGFMVRSTDWKNLSSEVTKRKESDDFVIGPDGRLLKGEDGKLIFRSGSIEPYEVLKYVNINSGIEEMKNKKVKIPVWQEEQIKRNMRDGDYRSLFESLPRAGKLFANLARNADSIYEKQKNKPQLLARGLRK